MTSPDGLSGVSTGRSQRVRRYYLVTVPAMMGVLMLMLGADGPRKELQGIGVLAIVALGRLSGLYIDRGDPLERARTARGLLIAGLVGIVWLVGESIYLATGADHESHPSRTLWVVAGAWLLSDVVVRVLPSVRLPDE